MISSGAGREAVGILPQLQHGCGACYWWEYGALAVQGLCGAGAASREGSDVRVGRVMTRKVGRMTRKVGRVMTRKVGRMTRKVGRMTRKVGRMTQKVGWMTRKVGRMTRKVVWMTRIQQHRGRKRGCWQD
jgi:hypothetical protein